MNIFENDYEINEETIVTLGKFDGLHEGHKKLIEMTVDEAKRKECKSLVYTFNQNPKEVLEKIRINKLSSKKEKIETLRAMGIDYIVFQDFTYEFSRISSQDFAKKIIKDRLNAKKVIVGFNHRFGKDAEGDIELLKQYGEKYGFEVEILSPVQKDGIIVSSSRMRAGILK